RKSSPTYPVATRNSSTGSRRRSPEAARSDPTLFHPRPNPVMIKKILLVLALALVAILVVAVFRPDTMHVARSATIAAPPSAVFAVVNDFRRWDDWSPWSKLDPEMKVNFEGPPIGVGAVYKWSGNNEVGEGSTTLVE